MALSTFIILGNYVFSKLFHQDFPGSPVARTRRSQCRGPRLDPWSYNYIPYAAAEDSAWHDLRSCMLQWRLKILHAITKTQCSQIHKLKKKKKLIHQPKNTNLIPIKQWLLLSPVPGNLCFRLFVWICLVPASSEWNHMLFVLLCRLPFTKQNVFKVHPCCSTGFFMTD